ncbi:MAG: hypothetical protein LBS42_03755 [Tannerella sp.]|jgi:hypothetical protein|nr:hypothetical protein [Tannerella sp.]
MKTPEGMFNISDIHNASGWEHDFADWKGEITGAYGPYFIRLLTLGHKGIGMINLSCPVLPMTLNPFFSILVVNLIALVASQMSSAQSLYDASNRQIGMIESGGTVYDSSGRQFGKIYADGRIYDASNKQIGKVPGRQV